MFCTTVILVEFAKLYGHLPSFSSKTQTINILISTRYPKHQALQQSSTAPQSVTQDSSRDGSKEHVQEEVCVLIQLYESSGNW